MIMSMLMEQLINITDALFLGHVGETELGASALAGIYYLAIYMLGFGFSLGLQVMIARCNGEHNYNLTGRTFFQGLYALFFMSCLLYLFTRLISPILLKNLITSPKIYQATLQYLNWRCYGLLFSFPALALRAFFTGIISTRALTHAAIGAIVINILLNYFLIFQTRLGISGAAMASSLAEMGSFLILLFYLRTKINSLKYGLQTVYDPKLLSKLFHLSVWSMLHAFISVVPWFLFFVVIEHLGQTELAISNIIRSVSTLFFVIVNSFASTTGSLVSNLIGAGQAKYLFPLCRKILRSGYAFGFPLITIALLCRHWIIGFYTDNEMLIRQAGIPFIVMLLNYTFALPGYVNAVTGTGNTKIAFVFQLTTIICYLFFLYMLYHYLQTDLAIYMLAEYLFVLLLAVQSVIYLKKYY